MNTKKKNYRFWIVGAALVALLVPALSVLEKKSFHAKVCRDFVAYLEKEIPGINVVAESDSVLQIQFPGNPEEKKTRLSLLKLHKRISESESQSIKDREEIYGEFVQILKESNWPLSDNPEHYRMRIFPLLITQDKLESMQGLGEKGKGIINRKFDSTGLFIVFVIDYSNHMSYIDKEVLKKIKFPEEQLYPVAMKNLHMHFPGETVRNAVEKKTYSSIKIMDGYDATRLLLVPEYLMDGESVAALVPDSNILTLAPLPDNGDWSRLQKLARLADGEPLLNKPILVTKKGFELK
ncbi:MAG: DUF1444 family protein [Candidatus Eremiobacteraeota bacterium]|nr:DUF1444 family protein [Candidatus Eremiobacteraeota bacterium]